MLHCAFGPSPQRAASEGRGTWVHSNMSKAPRLHHMFCSMRCGMQRGAAQSEPSVLAGVWAQAPIRRQMPRGFCATTFNRILFSMYISVRVLEVGMLVCVCGLSHLCLSVCVSAPLPLCFPVCSFADLLVRSWVDGWVGGACPSCGTGGGVANRFFIRKRRLLPFLHFRRHWPCGPFGPSRQARMLRLSVVFVCAWFAYIDSLSTDRMSARMGETRALESLVLNGRALVACGDAANATRMWSVLAALRASALSCDLISCTLRDRGACVCVCVCTGAPGIYTG